MTAPTPRSNGLDANARGLAVLAVAVVIGLLLLLKAGDTGTTQVAAVPGTTNTVDVSGIGGKTDNSDSTTTTPEDTTTSSSTPSDAARAPADVKVLVLNSGGPAGTAGATSSTVGEKGYSMATAGNAATRGRAATAIYYAAGFEVEAADIAGLLGKTSDAVKAMPTTSPGPGADKADIVVVLGKDTAPASSSGSATTTTSSN